jgi:hypothetical protein
MPSVFILAFMLSETNKSIMLMVILLNVSVLSVVAPVLNVIVVNVVLPVLQYFLHL